MRSYIAAQPAQPQPTAPPGPRCARGYQWKEVFLPEGTELRANFGKQSYFARVQGEEITYGEQALSPSCFANLHGSGNRNAWKAIWLRLPGSDAWLLADVCRSAQKASITRLLAGDQSDRTARGHAAGKRARRRKRRAKKNNTTN